VARNLQMQVLDSPMIYHNHYLSHYLTTEILH